MMRKSEFSGSAWAAAGSLIVMALVFLGVFVSSEMRANRVEKQADVAIKKIGESMAKFTSDVATVTPTNEALSVAENTLPLKLIGGDEAVEIDSQVEDALTKHFDLRKFRREKIVRQGSDAVAFGRAEYSSGAKADVRVMFVVKMQNNKKVYQHVSSEIDGRVFAIRDSRNK